MRNFQTKHRVLIANYICSPIAFRLLFRGLKRASAHSRGLPSLDAGPAPIQHGGLPFAPFLLP